MGEGGQGELARRERTRVVAEMKWVMAVLVSVRVENREKEMRRDWRASDGERPMAARTGEDWREPEWQALPALMQTPFWSRRSIMAAASVPEMRRLEVLGVRGADAPLMVTPSMREEIWSSKWSRSAAMGSGWEVRDSRCWRPRRQAVPSAAMAAGFSVPARR